MSEAVEAMEGRIVLGNLLGMPAILADGIGSGRLPAALSDLLDGGSSDGPSLSTKGEAALDRIGSLSAQAVPIDVMGSWIDINPDNATAVQALRILGAGRAGGEEWEGTRHLERLMDATPLKVDEAFRIMGFLQAHAEEIEGVVLQASGSGPVASSWRWAAEEGDADRMLAGIGVDPELAAEPAVPVPPEPSVRVP